MPIIALDGATFEDALRLARSFHAIGHSSHLPLDIDAVEEFFLAQDMPEGFLSFSKDSLVLGILYAPWFAPSWLQAVELIWYSEGFGGEVMRQSFEDWALSHGADEVAFSCMANDREPALRRLMSRGGYKPVEVAFRKAL